MNKTKKAPQLVCGGFEPNDDAEKFVVKEAMGGIGSNFDRVTIGKLHILLNDLNLILSLDV